MRFGLLVPHFGEAADRDVLVDGARMAERLGFDSLWVRDHVVFEPHGLEGSNRTFIDPFVTLAFLAGVTERIGFGTATVIPFRHPFHLAGSVAGLSWVGHRQLDLGVGGGGFAHEFELLGMSGVDRPDLMREHIAIARALWDGGLPPYTSERYSFREVSLDPAPAPLPRLWFGGSSPRASRLADESFDGWLPGRITFPTFEKRRATIAARRADRGVPMLLTGAMPLISVAATREEAVRYINVDGLLAGANRWWITPPSGSFTSADDLAGAVIAGADDDILEGVARYREMGADLLVLDLRFRFSDWVSQIEALAGALRLSERSVVA